MKLLQICSSVFLTIGLCASGYADEHFPFLAQVAKKSVNIRAGANTNFERLDQLVEGAEVVVVAKSFDWYKIQLPLSAKVFIRADYLKLTQNSSAELIGDKVNIRAAPNSDSTSLGIIKKGEAVKVIAQVNGWWRIEPPVQAVGWVRRDFLTIKAVTPNSLKAKEESKGLSLSLVDFKGRLKQLAEPKAGVRYELVLDDHSRYYVQSILNLDRFKGAQVLIKGFVAADNDHSSTHPVLHVVHISLLL